MNAFVIASGIMALLAALGHALAGPKMFYIPMVTVLREDTHKAVFAGMWHLITIHFAASSIYIAAAGIEGLAGGLTWIVAAQFAAYSVIFLALSARLGNPLRLFQWIIFALVPIFYGVGCL